MNRLDRYLFMQQLAPFGFFTLALAGIVWLSQTLPLMEIIIDNGHSGFIFVEFAALILPNVLIIVIPLAILGSTLFTVNKLFNESEMVVILSAGLSPSRIIRSTIAIGIFAAIILYTLHLVLFPRASNRLADRIYQIKQESVMSLLREKQFIHPTKGISIYIKESNKTGEIDGLFLHDQRDSANPVTYSAQQALLLQDSEELRLIMSKGVMQRYSVASKNLDTIAFDEFVFDLTTIIQRGGYRSKQPFEYLTSELFNPEKIINEGGRYPIGSYIAEGHKRLAFGLLGLTLPMYAFAMLLSAKYRRTGLGPRIVITGAIGTFIGGMTPIITTWVADNPDMYIASYAPSFSIFILTLIALSKNKLSRNLAKAPVAA